MKNINPGKISTIVLWVCMLITAGIFAFFYADIIRNPDDEGFAGTGFILNWSYILFLLSLVVLFLFSFIYFLLHWKRNPKSILLPLVSLLALSILLACSYVLGSGVPLVIPGYEGSENTPFWLKIADMWLYSGYVLLALAILALFGGILWSHIKKTN